MTKNRGTLEELVKQQLEPHDQSFALELFDELIESGDENDETAFDEVCDAYDIDYEEE